MLATSRFLDTSETRLIRLPDGREVHVPRNLLNLQDDGSYRMTAPLFNEIPATRVEPTPVVANKPDSSRNQTVETAKQPAQTAVAPAQPEIAAVTVDEAETTLRAIPVIAEELLVTKESLETGRVLIRKWVETAESVIDEPLLEESYNIERVPMNRVVSQSPVARQDGDTWILPVLEEVLVVEKRLVLREEVRITRVQREVRNPQKHSIRREHIEVERK